MLIIKFKWHSNKWIVYVLINQIIANNNKLNIIKETHKFIESNYPQNNSKFIKAKYNSHLFYRVEETLTANLIVNIVVNLRVNNTIVSIKVNIICEPATVNNHCRF